MEADDAPVGDDGDIQTHRHTDAVFVSTVGHQINATGAFPEGAHVSLAAYEFIGEPYPRESLGHRRRGLGSGIPAGAAIILGPRHSQAASRVTSRRFRHGWSQQ